ncbi:MAG TPA: hypothetical protein DFS52_24470 [Myxococcales bacterium]|jgi:hypothetical protein|nr:hypothetical protein [Myxococcales bacterium]
MAGGPVLTIHRAADKIGGNNCIALAYDGHRVLLDAGSRLAGDCATDPHGAIPRTLDISTPIAGLDRAKPLGNLRGRCGISNHAWAQVQL